MPEDKLAIVNMTQDDLVQVLQIEHLAFTDPWPDSIFASDMEAEDTIKIVAKIGTKIVGFAFCMLVLDEMHLTNIAVHPDFRRKKIGHQLIEHLFYKADKNGCSIMYLDVRKSNQAAITFYRGYGFDVLYERKGYYHVPPEDALVMSLNLRERFKSGVV